MKTCPHYEPQLALLAAGVLETQERIGLQSHLADCPKCRESLRELTEICQEHSEAAAHLPVVNVSQGYHQRLVQRLLASKPEATNGSGELISTWIASWNWRLAPPVGIACILLFIGLRPPSVNTPPLPSPVTVIANTQSISRMPRVESPATLQAYRRAAGQSSEALEELLASNASQWLTPLTQVTAFTRHSPALTE